jgi:hypothetical protein
MRPPSYSGMMTSSAPEFGHPDLEGENAKVNEDGKEFRGGADSAVFNRMRIDDPEKRILPAQAFEVLVDEQTHQTEAEKENQRQPEAAQEQQHNAIMSERYYRILSQRRMKMRCKASGRAPKNDSRSLSREKKARNKKPTLSPPAREGRVAAVSASRSGNG